MNPAAVHLDVHLGRLRLANPITVASGTFGYAREMAGVVALGRLGAILPKTITKAPRAGNPPPRTVETAAGMLNSIGLDNDGIESVHPAAVALPGQPGHEDHRQHRRQDPGGVRRRWPPAWTACPASTPWS